jgi:serine/threonine-protein kinase
MEVAVPARRQWLGLGLAIAIAAGTTTAHADDKAVADVLYEEAQRLIKDGRYAEACPKLVDSQRLDPGIGTALYLGDCWEHVHKLASAWGSYREALSLAERQNDKRAEVARKYADRLGPQLSKMTLAFAPGADAAAAEVRRAGKLVGRGELGVAVPIDGGTYAITVTAPNRKRWETTVTVPDQGGSLAVALQLGDAGGSVHAPATATAPRDTSSPPPELSSAGPQGPYWTGLRATGVAMAGVGLVGLVIGSALGTVAKGGWEDSNRAGRCDPATNFCTAEGLQMRADAKVMANASTAAFVIGGALAAGGLAIVLFAPRGRVVAIAPAVGGAVGATVVGRF